MENSLKGLILAAGTIITCVVISLAFYISREARQTAVSGAEEINKLNMEFAESDKLVYDNANVSGSEVINAIKKMDGQALGIYVKTSKTQTYYGYSFDLSDGELESSVSTNLDDALEAGNTNYINPYASFRGTIIRDANDMITGIKFEQI